MYELRVYEKVPPPDTHVYYIVFKLHLIRFPVSCFAGSFLCVFIMCDWSLPSKKEYVPDIVFYTEEFIEHTSLFPLFLFALSLISSL